MKSKNKFGFFMIIFILTTINFTPTSRAVNNYELVLNDEYSYGEIHWEYSFVNHTLIELLVNENYCNSDLLLIRSYEFIEWYVYLEDDIDIYWVLHIDGYSNLIELCESQDFHVFKEPAEFSYAWCYLEQDFYTRMIIPIHVSQYLNEFRENLPLTKQAYFQVNSSSIHEDFRTNMTHGHRIYEYNQEGIMQRYNIYYDNLTALEFTLIYYDIWAVECNCEPPGPGPYCEIFTILLIIFGVLFIVNLFIYAGMKEYYRKMRINTYRREVKY